MLISVSGVGFAILLVLLLDGIRDGTVAKSTTYVDHVGADVFVAREGVTNMALSASALPAAAVAQVAQVQDVRETTGIFRVPMIVAADTKKRPATVIGYDPAQEFGGPWKLQRGRLLKGTGEAVVDNTLADELGVGVGDQIQVAGASFRIVGLSGETANIAGKHVFLGRLAVQSLIGAGDIVSFVLVKVDSRATPQDVAQAINRDVPGLTATTRAQLSKNDRSLLSSLFIAPMNVMFVLGFLVGLAIIGLTMYTTTAERVRDFGVLKAIGATNTFLLRTVITQALLLGIAGFALGLAASMLAGPFIVRLVPDIGVSIRPAFALQTFAEVMAMSLVAAALPVVRIVRVDPLIVFRS